MGGKFSKKVFDVKPDVPTLHRFDIIALRPKTARLSKHLNKKGAYFLTKDDLIWAFDFDTVKVFQCFQLFDYNQQQRISSLDFFGALVLGGPDAIVEKMNFLFKMMDINDDGFLSYDDLIILVISATRGLARLKGYEEIPHEKIDRLVTEAFQRKGGMDLNEDGEMSMLAFTTYLLSHDACKAYYANLKGARAQAIDSSALVARRVDAVKQAASIRAEIAQVLLDLQELQEAQAAFRDERGGDLDLLRMGNNQSKSSSETHSAAGDAALRKEGNSGLVGATENKTSVVLPAELAAARRYFSERNPLQDAEVFTDARAGKPAGTSRNVFGLNFKRSLLTLWQKLPLNDDEEEKELNTAVLDRYVLMGLFDAVGLGLSNALAIQCLREVSTTERGRYRFEDILRWYRLNAIADENAVRSANFRNFREWCEFRLRLGKNVRIAKRSLRNALYIIEYQRHVLDDLSMLDERRGVSKYKPFNNKEIPASENPARQLFRSNTNLSSVGLPTDYVAKFQRLKNFLNHRSNQQRSTILLKFNIGDIYQSLQAQRVQDARDEQETDGDIYAQEHHRQDMANVLKILNNAENKNASFISTAASGDVGRDRVSEKGGGGSIAGTTAAGGVNSVAAKAAEGDRKSYGMNLQFEVKFPSDTGRGSTNNSTNRTPSRLISQDSKKSFATTGTDVADETDAGRDREGDGEGEGEVNPGGSALFMDTGRFKIDGNGVVTIEEFGSLEAEDVLAYCNHVLNKPAPSSSYATANRPPSAAESAGTREIETGGGANKGGGLLSTTDHALDDLSSSNKHMISAKGQQKGGWNEGSHKFLTKTTTTTAAAAAATAASVGGSMKVQGGAMTAENLENGEINTVHTPQNRQENASAVSAGTLATGASADGGGEGGPLIRRKQRVFTSVLWVCVELKPSATPEQQMILETCLSNFLSAVPLDVRGDIYTEIVTKVCNTVRDSDKPGNENNNNKSSSAGGGLGSSVSKSRSFMGNMLQMRSKTRGGSMGGSFNFASLLAELASQETAAKGKIILVALLHEKNWFHELEETLVLNDIYLSRALERLTVDINIVQRLRTLYQYASEFEHYKERIFGPQEEELGEEGMNPLKFAKDMRLKKKKYQENVTNAAVWKRELLTEHCRQLGVCDTGSIGEMRDRVARAYSRLTDLAGHGELSGFGRGLISKIFGRFRENKKSRLTQTTDSSGGGGSGAMVATKKPKPGTMSEMGSILEENGSQEGGENDDSSTVASEKSGRSGAKSAKTARSGLTRSVAGKGILGMNIILEEGEEEEEEKEEEQGSATGLNLWEFNGMLAAAGSTTIYNKQEYLTMMKEAGLLVDRDGNLRRKGLAAYYLHNGRLATDNDSIGVGSLDDVLAGKFHAHINFQPAGVSSLLSLVGSSAPYVHWVTKLVVAISALKDVKFESAVEYFSQIFGDGSVIDPSLDIISLIFPHEEDEGLEGEGGEKAGNSGMAAGTASKEQPLKSTSMFTEPGWLARFINNISQYLADGPEGVIPSLRSFVYQSFGKYDSWEKLFTEEIVDRIRFEMEAYDARVGKEMDAAGLSLGLEASGLQVPPAAPPAGHAAAVVDSVGTATTAGVLGNANRPLSPSGAGPATGALNIIQNVLYNIPQNVPVHQPQKGKEEDQALSSIDAHTLELEREKAEKEAAEQARIAVQRRTAHILSIIRDLFPSLPPEEDLPKQLVEYKEELVSLNDLQHRDDIQLTLQESKEIEMRKDLCRKKIEELNALIVERDKLIGAHSCAVYDAFRLFAQGTSSMGLGTVNAHKRGANNMAGISQGAGSGAAKATGGEISVRADLEGVHWAQFLPRGLGEFAPAKQAKLDKLERAQRRKQAALAALEREKIRRDMTDEDRERIKQQQLAALHKEWEEEEMELVQTACGMYFDAREEMKTSSELLELTRLWERLIALREERYPKHIRTAATQSNLGCVLLEVYGLDHPLGNNAIFLFEAAVEILMKKCNSDLVHRVLLRRLENNISSRLDFEQIYLDELRLAGEDADSPTAQEAASNLSHTFLMELSPTILICLNYIALLRATESVSVLRKSYELKAYVLYLSQFLVDKDKDKLLRGGVVNALFGMPVFAYANNNSKNNNSSNNSSSNSNSGSSNNSNNSTGSSRGEIFAQIAKDVYYKLEQVAHRKPGASTTTTTSLLSDETVSGLNALTGGVGSSSSTVGEGGAVEGTDSDSAAGRSMEAGKAAAGAVGGTTSKSSTVGGGLSKRMIEQRERSKKYEEQRKIDAKKRAELNQQRLFLYKLIQSDQITEIFNAKAGHRNNAENPAWGKEKNEDLEKSAEEYEKVLQSMSATMSSRGSGGDDD